MFIDHDKVLARANEIYAENKVPEQMPEIESWQVKAILMALIEALNNSGDISGQFPPVPQGTVDIQMK